MVDTEDRSKPTRPEWGSDVIAEALRRLGIGYA